MTFTAPYGTLEMTAEEAVVLIKALIKDAPTDFVQGILAIPGALLAMLKAKVQKP